jgi:hypothetical protein
MSPTHLDILGSDLSVTHDTMTHITLTAPTYLQTDETYTDEKDLFQSLYLKMFGSQHINDVDFRSHDEQKLPAELVAK